MGRGRAEARPGRAPRSRSGTTLTRIVRSIAARRDVAAIAHYVGQRDRDAARLLLSRIDDLLHLLADNPRVGAPRPEGGRGLRSFNVPPYIVFYRPLADGIALLRVVHGSRDVANLLRDR